MTRCYLTAARLDEIALGLSPRDIAVLRTLRAYQLASGSQLRRWHYTGRSTPETDARAARHGLRRLADTGLLAHLERRVGGVRAGSASFVWHLSRAGYRLLATIDSNPLPGRIDRAEPSLRTVDHTLAIAEVAVQLREAERAGTVDVIECTPEPASWRTYLNAGGGLVTLKPDLFAVTAAKGAEFEDVWFIEVDRATESLPTIRRKAAQYDRYRVTGKEQASQGVFPKVVWLTPDSTRAEQITAALAGVNGGQHASHVAMQLTEFAGFVATGDLSQPDSPVHLPLVAEGEHP